MPASLGSATYELLADNSQLLAGFAQAEGAARQATGAVQAAVKAQQAVIAAAGTSMEGVYRQVAQTQLAAAQTAIAASQQASKAFADQVKAAQPVAAAVADAGKAGTVASASFLDLAKSGIGMAAAFGGVTLGALTVKNALEEMTKSAIDAEQAEFQLAAVFGESAKASSAWAEALADATGTSDEAIKRSLITTKLFTEEFGLSAAQAKQLTERVLDLTAVYGGDFPTRMQQAEQFLLGQGRAGLQLGISLKALTEDQKKQLDAMGPAEKAQATFALLMEQSADKAGKAREAINTTGGALKSLGQSAGEVGETLGRVLLPPIKQLADDLRAVTKEAQAVDAWLKTQPELLAAMGAAWAGMTKGPAAFGQALVGIPKAVEDIKKAQEEAAASATAADAVSTDGIKATIEARERIQKESRERQHKDQLDAIKQDEQEQNEAFDRERTRLEAEREGRLRTLEQQTTDKLDAIKAQADAEAAASAANISRLERERDQRKRIQEQIRDDALEAIRAAREATHEAADANIRDLEIERDNRKRTAETTRDDAIHALDDEKRARDRVRTEEDRATQDSVTAAKRAIDDRHQAAVRGLEAEGKAVQAHKQEVVRALEDEAQAVRATAQKRLASLEAQSRKAQQAHDQRVKHIQAEQQAAQKAHDQAVRRIEDQARAAEKEHEAKLRALAAEVDAADHAHDQLLRSIDAERDAADRRHDAAVDAIDREKDAEDDRHREAVRNIEAEQKRREAAIDAQIDALDALAEADANAREVQHLQDTLTNAQGELQKAGARGNQVDIDAAQRAVMAAQTALAAHATKVSREAARDQLQAQKSALKEEIDARKDAESEQERLRKDDLDAQKAAADDTLELVKRDTDARKDASAEALRLLREQVDAQKQAADDTFALVKEGLEQQKQAADDALKATQERLAKQSQAADDALAKTQARINAQKAAVQAQAQEELAAIAEKKQAAEDEAAAALEQIAARKQAEADRHEAEGQALADSVTATQRALADKRAAEDEADRQHREQANQAHEAALEAIRAEYDDEATGVIPAIRRAVHEADIGYAAQTRAVQQHAQDAIAALDEEYNGEQGSITLARAAAAETAKQFAQMTKDVQRESAAQAQAIKDVYSNAGKTGWIDLMEASRDKMRTTHEQQAQFVRDYAKVAVEEVNKVIAAWDALNKQIQGINPQGGVGAGQYGPNVPANAAPGSSLRPGSGAGGPGSSGRGTGGGSGAGQTQNLVPYSTGSLPPIDYSSRESFARTAYPYALQAAGGNPELANRLIASAISEANAGSGTPPAGFNFGGIKHDPEASGGSATLMTWEQENGQRVNQNASFAQYSSPEEGFAAIPRFLQTNFPQAWARYQQTGDATQLYRDINAGGYATNPNWHRDIESITENQVAPVTRQVPMSNAEPGATATRPMYVVPIEGMGPAQRHWGTALGGTDIFAPEGTPIQNIAAGRVLSTTTAGTGGPGGNSVLIQGDDGKQYYYAHLKDVPNVVAGQTVAAGDILGGVGTTGNAAGTPAHLHLGIGEGIQNGTGPQGGTGTNFDAIQFLNDIRDGKYGQPLQLLQKQLDETGNSFALLGDAGEAAGVTIDEGLTTATDGTETFTKAATDSTAAVGGAFINMKTVGVGSVNDLGGATATILDDMAGTVVGTVTDMSGNVVAQYATLANGANVEMGDLASGTTTTVTQMGDTIATVVEDTAGNVITTFTDLSGNVVGQTVQMAAGTTDAAAGLSDDLDTEFTGLGENTTKTFTDTFGRVVDVVTDGTGQVTKTIHEFNGDTTEIFTDLEGNVTTTVRDLAGNVIEQFTKTADGGTKVLVPAFKEVDKAGQSIKPVDMSKTIENLKKAEKQATSTAKALDKVSSSGGDKKKGSSSSSGKKASGGGDGEGGEFGGFATGGIVWNKQLAWLAENGPELVVPLADLGLGGSATSAGSLIGAVPSGAMMTDAASAGALSGGGSSNEVNIHLHGDIYDGARFEDRLVSSLVRADVRGRLRFLK